MPVTSHELLNLAEEDSVKGNEIYYRNAAAKAYYACFHHCKELIELLDEATDVTGTHQRFLKTLTRATNTKTRSIGYRLKQIYDHRISADYYIGDSFEKDTALECVSTVKGLFKEIDDIS